MISLRNKTFWLILFIAMQCLFIILHISKQSIWIKMSYTTQKYETAIKKLHEQKKELLHTLYELQNPKEIKRYAQEKLGMNPLKISAIKRINSNE